MDSVKEKVYAVTGMGGIGLSVAKILYTNGAYLSLADINPDFLKNALSQLDPSVQSSTPRILTTVLDISNSTAVTDWIKRTTAHFGRLDGAANMAAAIGPNHGVGKLIDTSDEEWDLLIGVNLSGMMYCLRAEIRAIMETAGAKGSIVNAASIQGLRGFANHAAYSASKHGVVGLSRSVAKEVGEGIRINVVAP